MSKPLGLGPLPRAAWPWIGLVVLFGFFALVWPYAGPGIAHTARQELKPAPAVHTYALPDEECRLPSEHEQLHIIVVQRAGRLRLTCMHVAPRGAYRTAR